VSVYTDLVAERVAAGAQLLDEQVPGWYRQIDTSTLDMADGCNCICGQLAGEGEDWVPMVTFLSGVGCFSDHIAWGKFVRNHGFSSSYLEEVAWLEAIQARLDHDALPAVVEERELVVA
jgi:hypothetical protein